MESESLEPENFLIIGGHSGIGKRTSEYLRGMYPNAEFCVPERNILDVQSKAELRACVKQEGPFSHIVYSAGINQLAWVDDPEMNVLMAKMMDTNCFAFAMLLSYHIQLFPAERFSAVAVSSDAGRVPMRGSLAYCVSKAALDMAVKVLARELAPGCRVNAVAPGIVEGTAMTRYIDETIPDFREWIPEFAHEYEKQGIPTGRRATLDEVAKTIAWVLMGPWQMTGTIVDINGGRR